MESIAKSEIEQKLIQFCDEELTPKGFRVVDLDCRVGGRSLLRIFIEGVSNHGATLDDCAIVSNALGTALETKDYLPGAYDLEVSSPGLDRRLRLRSDFENAVGERVRIQLWEKIEGGGANLAGILEAVESEGLRVEVDKKKYLVPLHLIKQATRLWEGRSA